MKEILFHGPSLRHGWLAAAHNGLPQMQLLHDLRHFRRAGGVAAQQHQDQKELAVALHTGAQPRPSNR